PERCRWRRLHLPAEPRHVGCRSGTRHLLLQLPQHRREFTDQVVSRHRHHRLAPCVAAPGKRLEEEPHSLTGRPWAYVARRPVRLAADTEPLFGEADPGRPVEDGDRQRPGGKVKPWGGTSAPTSIWTSACA